MVALYIIIGIILFFGLLMLVRVKVLAAYGPNGAMVTVHIGPVRRQVVPPPEKKEKRKKEKKAPPEEETEEEPPKEKDAIGEFRRLLRPVLDVLGKIKRTLWIEQLELTYVSGGKDPAMAAIGFGFANAALGMLASFLESQFHVRSRNYRTELDYSIERPVIYANATLSLRIGQIFAMGISFLIAYMKQKNAAKKVQEKGQVLADEKKEQEEPAKPA